MIFFRALAKKEVSMRLALLSATVLCAALAAPAKAGPNVPFCLAMETNYRDCVRAREARDRHSENERHWMHEQMERGEMDPEEWERMRHRQRHQEERGDACAPMLLALKQNGCF